MQSEGRRLVVYRDHWYGRCDAEDGHIFESAEGSDEACIETLAAKV